MDRQRALVDKHLAHANHKTRRTRGIVNSFGNHDRDPAGSPVGAVLPVVNPHGVVGGGTKTISAPPDMTPKSLNGNEDQLTLEEALEEPDGPHSPLPPIDEPDLPALTGGSGDVPVIIAAGQLDGNDDECQFEKIALDGAQDEPVKPQSDWQTGLCSGCVQDHHQLFGALCCPCWMHTRVAQRLRQYPNVDLEPSPIHIRGAIRERLNIRGSKESDFWTSVCCIPCTLAQGNVELKRRALDSQARAKPYRSQEKMKYAKPMSTEGIPTSQQPVPSTEQAAGSDLPTQPSDRAESITSQSTASGKARRQTSTAAKVEAPEDLAETAKGKPIVVEKERSGSSVSSEEVSPKTSPVVTHAPSRAGSRRQTVVSSKSKATGPLSEPSEPVTRAASTAQRPSTSHVSTKKSSAATLEDPPASTGNTKASGEAQPAEKDEQPVVKHKPSVASGKACNKSEGDGRHPAEQAAEPEQKKPSPASKPESRKPSFKDDAQSPGTTAKETAKGDEAAA
ncbi:hypothetical protein K431DRAFT_79366 [Polychaeton citri CBS 116435]|uniref:PLAC8-domain-containing protein n=1 Tax=Polychaeton citri CBS 116435 TaxID=1314669 RepID=A0A9P4UUA8_9PEZI|nr:hypothetical protein K431DRAFT_79366 [Polychaeton citri CBS 116435]